MRGALIVVNMRRVDPHSNAASHAPAWSGAANETGDHMKFHHRLKPAGAGFFVALAVLCLSGRAGAADEEAARDLARANNCFKCHGVDKKKDGPAWREIAAKYKGKADAEERLIKHLTTGEKAKFPDGHEEDHKIVKAKDPNETRNLVQWILSL
jgi:cytochrome c